MRLLALLAIFALPACARSGPQEDDPVAHDTGTPDDTDTDTDADTDTDTDSDTDTDTDTDTDSGGDTDTGEPVPGGCVPRSEGYVTDSVAHAPGELPSLPTANSVATDPVFGTTIVRLTDEADDPTGCLHSYSYWPTFNADSSRLVLYCYESGLRLYEFDQATLTATGGARAFPAATPAGSYPSWSDVIWSSTDPDVLWAHDTYRLWAYDVTTGTFTLVRDFTTDTGGVKVLQMSKSADDDVFAWHTLDEAAGTAGWVVYRRSTDTVTQTTGLASLDEVQVDKSGRWLMVMPGTQGVGVVAAQVVDLETGAVEDLVDDVDAAPGHRDVGTGLVVGRSHMTNEINVRTLDAPHDRTTLLAYGSDWTQADHTSLRARDEDWALVSTYTANTYVQSAPWIDEILQVRTDGSGEVRRLAHHRSIYAAYWDSPRANISADGCYVTFTSNWGAPGGRTDVYVLSLAE